MVAALQRLTASFFSDWRSVAWQPQHVAPATPKEEADRVGEYYADYSELTDEEIDAPIPEADDLLARSTVVSIKRL